MRCVGSITSADFVLLAKKQGFLKLIPSRNKPIFGNIDIGVQNIFKIMLWGSLFSTSLIIPFQNARFID